MQVLPKPNWFAAFPIELPSELHDWFSRLPESTPAGVKLFSPCDLHVTVAFFGPLEEGQVNSILHQLNSISFAPVPVSFGKTLALPRRLTEN